jgi:hypothetical protein
MDEPKFVENINNFDFNFNFNIKPIFMDEPKFVENINNFDFNFNDIKPINFFMDEPKFVENVDNFDFSFNFVERKKNEIKVCEDIGGENIFGFLKLNF